VRERERESLCILEETIGDEATDKSKAKEAAYDSEEPVKARDILTRDGDVSD